MRCQWLAQCSLNRLTTTPCWLPVIHAYITKYQGSWGQLGTTWVLSPPGGPHVDPMNLAIRVVRLYARWAPNFLMFSIIFRLFAWQYEFNHQDGLWYIDNWFKSFIKSISMKGNEKKAVTIPPLTTKQTTRIMMTVARILQSNCKLKSCNWSYNATTNIEIFWTATFYNMQDSFCSIAVSWIISRGWMQCSRYDIQSNNNSGWDI